MTPDHYKTLELAPEATEAEIGKAYRRLARLNHPDKNKSDDAQRIMDEVNRAYKILSDPEKKREYDAERAGGRRRVRPVQAAEVARWTAQDSNLAAQQLREGRLVGQEATARGAKYSIEWVTFGEGDGAVERPALCSNGEVLESDEQPATSHPVAGDAEHKSFAAARADIEREFNEAERKRETWKGVIDDIRARLCDGDASLGEGNRVVVNGSSYSVAVVPFLTADGEWSGQRVLLRNGASLEALPESAVPTRFASGSDVALFVAEQDALRDAVEEFLNLRGQVNKIARETRRDLDPNDGVVVQGVTYAFEWTQWRGADGAPAHGLVLCADHHPLEDLPGRAIEKQDRGQDIETLWRFRQATGEVIEQFKQLREARAGLLSAVSPIMRDLQVGDQAPWGTGPGAKMLHVVDLPWSNNYSSGTQPTLCWGEVALNPHWGILVAEGYRRANLYEAREIAERARSIRTAMRNIIGPRETARLQREWQQQQAAMQQGQWAPYGNNGAPREKHKGRGGRFLGGILGGKQQGPPEGPPASAPGGGPGYVGAPASGPPENETAAPVQPVAPPPPPRGLGE